MSIKDLKPFLSLMIILQLTVVNAVEFVCMLLLGYSFKSLCIPLNSSFQMPPVAMLVAFWFVLY